MVQWIVGDFETVSEVDLLKAGSWVYAEHPSTEILCFNYQSESGVKYHWNPNVPGLLLQLFARNPVIFFIAHHAEFEKAIWRRIMVPKFGFPDIPNDRWHCTLARAAQLALPQGLDEVVRVLRLPALKDMEGSKLVKTLNKQKQKGLYQLTPELSERVSDYCDDDVDAEVGLHKRLSWPPRFEREFWIIHQRMNERGVRLDLEFVDAAQSIVDQALAPLLKEHEILTGGLAPTQINKLLKWIEGQGVAYVPDLRKETVAELLGFNIDEGEADLPEHTDNDDVDYGVSSWAPVLPNNVRRVLEIRQLSGSSSVKKLARMKQCTCNDGRSRGLMQYHGTAPGRSAGRLWQPLNFPRPTISDENKNPYKPRFVVDVIKSRDPEFVSMILGSPPIQCVVSALRHAVIPDPGRVLLSGDYAGIQARVVLALAGQHDKTKLMADGKDVYIDMAELIYKCVVDKKRDPEKRQTGKNSVLGLGFQMAAKTFRVKYAKAESLEFCEHVVRTYRKEWAPKVPYCWYGLERAAVETVWEKTPHEAFGIEYALEDEFLTARLPSGRKLYYYNPRPVRKAMPWDNTDVRRGFTFQAKKGKAGQWKTINAFGGQLTENVVMGIEVDIQRYAMLQLEKAGFPVVLEVYDEIVVEPLVADADEKAFEQILLDTPKWVSDMQIPIAVETWSGDHYRK